MLLNTVHSIVCVRNPLSRPRLSVQTLLFQPCQCLCSLDKLRCGDFLLHEKKKRNEGHVFFYGVVIGIWLPSPSSGHARGQRVSKISIGYVVFVLLIITGARIILYTVETLLDCGVYCSQRLQSPFLSHITRFTPPPPPYTVSQPSTHTAHDSDSFGNFLRRLAILLASKHVSMAFACTVKRLSFSPSPAGMSPTKFSLAEYNLIIPGQAEFGQ